MTKAERMQAYEKYDGRCAYCGKKIEYKDMQVDHIVPKLKGGKNEINNYNPACRRCNHYKDTFDIEQFRQMLKTMHERTQKIYINKVAEDYGIIQIKPWDGVFYFEREAERDE